MSGICCDGIQNEATIKNNVQFAFCRVISTQFYDFDIEFRFVFHAFSTRFYEYPLLQTLFTGNVK